MSPDLMTRLNTLVERWENLADAAGAEAEHAGETVQNGFYAGILFGLDIAREELITMLATAMAEDTQSLAAMQMTPEFTFN